MLYGQDRDAYRRVFVQAWRKAQAGEPLSDMEAMLADLIALHPEYHAILTAEDAAVGAEFPPELGESNPFMHLSLHLALREQRKTDRPPGFRYLYDAVCTYMDDVHDAEHAMSECLAEIMWQAQRDGAMPDEKAYFACLRKLAHIQPGFGDDL